MVWPWVTRKQLEAAESRLRWTEEQLRRKEMEAIQMHILAGERAADALSAREETKLYIDRIVQMSGQPPIFHPLPMPLGAAETPKSEPEGPGIAGPATRLSFDDVHKKARQAIRNGDMDAPKAVRL